MKNTRQVQEGGYTLSEDEMDDTDDFLDTDECINKQDPAAAEKRSVTPTIERGKSKVGEKNIHNQAAAAAVQSQSNNARNNVADFIQSNGNQIKETSVMKSDSKQNQIQHQLLLKKNSIQFPQLQQENQIQKQKKSSPQNKNFNSLNGNHPTNTQSQKMFETTNSLQNFNTQQSNNKANLATFDYAQQQQQPIATQQSDPEYEQDFNKAYRKLIEKVYSEQGQNLLISQDELAKIAYQQQLSVQDFNQRTQQSHENKQQKTKMLEEAMKIQEMQECTFKPQTYSKKQQRNFDQFLKDQLQFEEQKLRKKQERIEQSNNLKSMNIKSQPQVNRKSTKIVEDKKKLNTDQKENESTQLSVHLRLHNIHNERLQKQTQQQKQEYDQQKKIANTTRGHLKKTKSEANFLSSGNPRSRERNAEGKTIDEVLYDDAKRRWETQEQKKLQLAKLKDEQIQSTRPPTGHNNTKFAAKKFEKEFVQVCSLFLEEIMNDQQNENSFSLETKLNYVKINKLMTELGFIPYTINTAPADSVEKELLFEMWNLLKGEELNGITLMTLKKFFLAIQGITLDIFDTNAHQSSNRISDQPRQSTISLEGYDEKGILRLSQGEVNKIFVKFKPFYINRIQFLGLQKKSKYVDQSCTFKPQISKVTEQLAIQKRIKILSDTLDENGVQMATMDSSNPNKKVDILHILLHPSNIDQQWKENAKQILDSKELEECTFKPKISNYESNLTKSKSQSRMMTSTFNNANVGAEKCMELYMRAKPTQEKRDKTKNDFDYEKGREECTFQPNVIESQRNFDNIYLQNGNSQLDCDLTITTSTIKGYEGQMNRMKKAREQKDRERMMHSRGIPGTQNDEGMLQPMHIGQNRNYKGTFSAYAYNAEVQQNVNNQSQTYQTKLSNSKSIDLLTNTTSNSTNRRQSSGRSTVANNISSLTMDKRENVYLKENKNLTNQIQLQKSDSRKIFKTNDNNMTTSNEKIKSSVTKSSRYSDEYYNYDFNNGEKIPMPDADNDSILHNTNSSLMKGSKQPLLYVDVNLGPGKSERIVVYDGDTADSLAENFTKKHSLDQNMKSKLTQLLDSQIAGLLEKIDEEQVSIHSDNI